MERILVPTDFSTPAQWASDLAVTVAKRTHAEILLLHVIDLPSQESFNVEAQVENIERWEDKLFAAKLIERGKAQLQEAAGQLAAHGVGVKTALRLGNAFHGITELITEQEVDLVVIGSAGRSRSEGETVGSNTQKIVRHAKCPVLTVHQKPMREDFANIVYATGLNEQEGSFAEVLKNIQEIYNSTIHLVRINTPVNFLPDHNAKARMQIFARNLNLQRYTLHVFSDFSEEEGIVHFGASINADLIAMATHGRTGLPHLLIGSIAEDVVSNSSRPVLTFVTN